MPKKKGSVAGDKHKFESVFCADDDWKMNACLNYSQNPLDLYASGYKEAADELVKNVLLRAPRIIEF